MKNILLVEYKKRPLAPLGLMKISTYHKLHGDVVDYVVGFKYFIQKPDIIYITTLYTFEYYGVIKMINSYKHAFPNAKIYVGGVLATLLAKDLEQDTNLKPIKGKMKNIDNLKPDYSLFPKIDYSIANTTRSCVRNCGWCMVKKVEGEYNIIKDWENMLDLSKPRIHFIDNNITAAGTKHVSYVVNKLLPLRKHIDFNGGIDCRFFDYDVARELLKLKLETIRFSFDSLEVDGIFQNACKMALSIKGTAPLVACVLYGFNDTPEDFYYRITECLKHRCKAYPMRFQPLNSKIKNKFIGRYWSKTKLNNFKRLLNNYYSNQIIGLDKNYSYEKFLLTFGRNKEEFIEIISRGEEND